jgi:drug/metabolite transporter (DMT)-like permease
VSALRFGLGYGRSGWYSVGASRRPAAPGASVEIWRLWLLGAAGAGLFGPLYNAGIATSNPVMVAIMNGLPGWSQVRITTATLGPGVVMIIAFYLIAILLGLSSFTPGPPRDALDIGLVLWIGVGGVTFAMLFRNFGAQRLGLVVAALFLNLMPIVTILVLALKGQMPTWLPLAGTALVLVGLLQAQLQALPARRIA